MPQSITPIPINTLLERSDAFETSIRACFPDSGYVLGTASPVNALAATACLLCAEHAAALRAAFAIECPNSGSAVLRLEYESLLRAAWLLYGATPIEVDKLTCTLDLDAEQRGQEPARLSRHAECSRESGPRRIVGAACRVQSVFTTRSQFVCPQWHSSTHEIAQWLPAGNGSNSRSTF